MQREKVLITKVGLEKLKAELEYRKNIKKQNLVDMLITSKDAGDERENDGFSLAFEDFQINEQRIIDLEEALIYHEIIAPKQFKKIELGHTVILRDIETNKEVTIQIVGDMEIDPQNGKISLNSPIAQSVLRKRIGDIINKGLNKHEIVSIT